MRVGLAQTEPRFGEIARNIEHTVDLIGSQSADLWILPEFFATGYQFVSATEVAVLAETIPGGRTTGALAAFCQKRGCHVVAGLAETAAGVLYNSAVLVGPNGLLACYRKIHLFGKETVWFNPGNRPFSVHAVGEARVGMMICFDHLFPESARSLALLGADLIAHPSNLVLPDLAQRTMAVRALENGVFTATANRVGEEARDGTRLHYTGASQIVAPTGDVLIRLSPDRAEVAVLDIDLHLARSKRITDHNDRLADRRPDMYTVRNPDHSEGER